MPKTILVSGWRFNFVCSGCCSCTVLFEDQNSIAAAGSTALHLTCRGVEGSWRPGLSKYSTEVSSRRGQSESVDNHQRPELVELLLWAGADFNLTDKLGAQPIHIACAYGNEAVILKLLEVCC